MEVILETSKQMCRMCMSEEDVMLYAIHENPGSRNFDIPLPLRIMACLGIDVFPYDALPQFICHRCLYKVDSYYEFKEECKQCDKLLRKEKNDVTPLLGRKEEEKHEMSSSESSEELEECEEEPPVVMVNKSYCWPADDLPDPLALPDSGSNSQQEAALDSDATLASSTFLDAEIIECVPLVGTRENLSPRKLTDSLNASKNSATYTKTKKRTLKKKLKEKFVDIEDVIKKQRNAYIMRQTAQVRKVMLHQACPVCDVVCKLNEFERHMMSHRIRENGNKKFTCLICRKSFSVKFSLTRHMLIHNSVKPFECSNCDRTFSDRSNLIKHERTHSDLRPFSCHLCQAEYSDNSYLLKHLRKFHDLGKPNTEARPKVVVPNTDHECYTKRERNTRKVRSQNCKESNDENYMQRKNISTPMESILLTNAHNEDHIEDTETQQIGLQEEPAEVIVEEVTHDISEPLTNYVKGLLVCRICFSSFHSYEELDKHKTKHGIRNYVCEVCDKEFQTKVNLEFHQKTHFMVSLLK